MAGSSLAVVGHERLHKPLLHLAGEEDENKLERFQQAEAKRMGS